MGSEQSSQGENPAGGGVCFANLVNRNQLDHGIGLRIRERRHELTNKDAVC